MTIDEGGSRSDLLSGLSESERLRLSLDGSRPRQSELGQFFTPASIATLMSGLFQLPPTEALSILDPGAGVGSLSLALLDSILAMKPPPKRVALTAFEVDPVLAELLRSTLAVARTHLGSRGIRLDVEVRCEDFVITGSQTISGGLFHQKKEFDLVITNPPYKKINSTSEQRLALHSLGLTTSNLYAAFLAVGSSMLREGGQIVSITPRSFCNGRYFESFRAFFLARMRLRQIHLFDSRRDAFADDAVLQENVILHASREPQNSRSVIVSRSKCGDAATSSSFIVPFSEIVHPGDQEKFVYVPGETDPASGFKVGPDLTTNLPDSLQSLSLRVSTGRVVLFRNRVLARSDASRCTVPFVHASNFRNGVVMWPNEASRHPQHLIKSIASSHLLMPSGYYVLIRRLSSKEERRRLFCAVFDPTSTVCDAVAFENHLNVIHCDGEGLERDLAYGLAAFLNSSTADRQFRAFSGHTQVNAGDLKRLRLPSLAAMAQLAKSVEGRVADQDYIDEKILRVFGRNGQSHQSTQRPSGHSRT